MKDVVANDLRDYLLTHDVKGQSSFEIYNTWNDSSQYVLSLRDIDVAAKIIKLYAKNHNLPINFGY